MHVEKFNLVDLYKLTTNITTKNLTSLGNFWIEVQRSFFVDLPVAASADQLKLMNHDIIDVG